VLQLEVLVPELSSVDRLAASAVEVGEVAALAHELGNHAMEDRSLVSEALLPGAEGPEILGGIRHHIAAQLHGDPAKLLTASRQVEEHPW